MPYYVPPILFEAKGPAIVSAGSKLSLYTRVYLYLSICYAAPIRGYID